MTKEEIFKEVQGLIAKATGWQESDIKMESKFDDDLGLDSLDTVELVMNAEIRWQTAIPDDVIEKLTTVGGFVDYLFENINHG